MSRSEESIPKAGFGEYLRREREMRGVPLEEISTATKISIRFLEAIETDELAKLPGGIFTRSFVRTYARYLGLDEERVLSDCQLAGLPKPEIDLRRFTVSRPTASTAASRTQIAAILVAVALLAGGYALFRYSRRSMEQQNSMPVVIPPATAPHAANVPTASTSEQPLPASQQESGSPLTATATPAATGAATAPGAPQGIPPSQPVAVDSSQRTAAAAAAGVAPAAGTELGLQVAATERAWVAVEADGKTVLQRVLNPNEVENLKAHESFYVTTGNAQGVILTLNGETLKPLGRRGEVKSIRLTRDDLKSAAPAR